MQLLKLFELSSTSTAALANGVPAEWVARFETIADGDTPDGFLEERWQSLVIGGAKFMEQWAGAANEVGWAETEVLGLHRTAPAGRVDGRGLAWLLGSRDEVVSLDEAGADIRNADGVLQRYYRRPA
jgi:hypothetical protein